MALTVTVSPALPPVRLTSVAALLLPVIARPLSVTSSNVTVMAPELTLVRTRSPSKVVILTVPAAPVEELIVNATSSTRSPAVIVTVSLPAPAARLTVVAPAAASMVIASSPASAVVTVSVPAKVVVTKLPTRFVTTKLLVSTSATVRFLV